MVGERMRGWYAKEMQTFDEVMGGRDASSPGILA